MSQQAGTFDPPLTVSCVDVRIGAASSVVVPREEKLEKLIEQNFQWWQQKNIFLLDHLESCEILEGRCPCT